MIGSKKITFIAVFLTVAAVAFVIYAMIIWDETTINHTVGKVFYGEKDAVVFTEDDYYSEHKSATEILLDGTTAACKDPNVRVDDSTVTILGGGTYVLSGTFSGTIIVDSGDNAVVRLVFSGASVSSEDFSALYVKQAEKVVLSLAEGTENLLSDGSTYNTEKMEDGKPSAALYSKDSITVNGTGKLTVAGNYMDGIKSNDALKIMEGTISVTAKDEAINVNDYIIALEAVIELTAGGDALKCENENSEQGFIVLDKTTLTIHWAEDGIYSSSSVYVNELKGEIAVADDALHGENEVKLSPKNLTVTACTEGIEGACITIDGGDIRIVSQDDGINARGENSTGGFPRPMGRQNAAITDKDIYLTINGGTIYIETSGDGVDSNGAAVINGGRIEVYGPENNGNSSLDFEYGFLINGGEVLAAGSSGMAELPHDTSGQNSLVFYLDETVSADSEITLSDSEGNVLLSGTSSKKFNWVCVSCKSITAGKTYTLSVNGRVVQTVEATEIVTSTGNSGRRW